MDLSGVTNSTDNLSSGITIFDHPSNINSPAPWYMCIKANNRVSQFLVIIRKPLALPPRKQLNLTHNVFVHEGAGSESNLEEKRGILLRKFLNKSKK